MMMAIMIFLILNCLVIMVLGVLTLVIMSMFVIILWYVRNHLQDKLAMPSTNYRSQRDTKHFGPEVHKDLNCNTFWSNYRVVKSSGDGHCFIHSAANSLNVNSSKPTPFGDVSVIFKHLSDETE